MVEEKYDLTEEQDQNQTVEVKKSEFATLYEVSIAASIKVGSIVKGKIIGVTPKDVIVDIGYKSEGAIALSEFGDPESIKIGDDVDVYLESRKTKTAWSSFRSRKPNARWAGRWS